MSSIPKGQSTLLLTGFLLLLGVFYLHGNCGPARRDALAGKNSGTSAKPSPPTLESNNASSSDTVSRAVTVATSSDILPADRLYDWGAYCGVPGGIPNRTTIYTSLGVPGQSPSYAQSVTALQIVTAFTNCPSGQVVYLYPGTYTLSPFTLPRVSGKTLRGAGPGQTIFRPAAGGDFISLAYTSWTEASGITVSSGYTQRSTAIVLASTPTSNFAAGNLIVIAEDNSHDKWAPDIGVYLRTNETYSPRIYNLNMYRNFTYTTRVVSVAGNTVNIATPIPLSFTTTNIKAYPPDSNGMLSMCGIENLTLDGSNITSSNHAIQARNADRFWVKNIEVKNFSGGDTGLINFDNGFQCEINRCYIHDCYNFPNQVDGQGLCLNYGASNNLIVDTIAYRVASLVQSNGANANAVIYNYTEDLGRSSGGTLIQPAILHHGGHGYMNLNEGNILTRYQQDGYHGSISHEVIFRNQFHGVNVGMPTYTWMRQMIELERWSYYFSVVGNILGDSSWNPVGYESHVRGTWDSNGYIYNLGYGYPTITCSYYTAGYPDPNVDATLLRHGNYDYFHKDVVWDSGIASRTIPDSYFYSSKPGFFGSLQWPPIGPDVSGLVTDIPAKARWNAYLSSGNLADLFDR